MSTTAIPKFDGLKTCRSRPPTETRNTTFDVMASAVAKTEAYVTSRFSIFERELDTRLNGGGADRDQLTDALQEVAADPSSPGVYGVVFRGRRYDTGDRVDYIKAIVQLAADRDDLGPELRPWFKEFAAGL